MVKTEIPDSVGAGPEAPLIMAQRLRALLAMYWNHSPAPRVSFRGRSRSARVRNSLLSLTLLSALASAAAVFVAAELRHGSLASATEAAIVTMTDEPAKFVPEKLRVPVGTTVVWKNTGATLHTVTADAAKAKVASHVSLPQGAKEFDSGPIAPGATYAQTFTVPGTYKYICMPHESDGMIGEVDVTK